MGSKMFNASTIFTCSFCILCLILDYTSSQIQAPQSDKDKIRLYYYPNPLNTTERYDLMYSMHNSQLAKNKRAKIIIHGAGSHCLKDDVPFRSISAYLRAKVRGEDYNVMCLDYGALSLTQVPGESVPTVRSLYEYVCDLVSEQAVRLILALETNAYITDLAQIHIIGHSLGGQISGFIGRKLQEQAGNSLGRITGLDIANVMQVYSNEVNLQNQLDLSDAKFVDIVHTSQIGLRGNYGHVDFYPDGGLRQRSCLTKGPISNVTEFITGSCSHGIVGKYWESSIDLPNITACKDVSWDSFLKRSINDCPPEKSVVFGEYVPTTARGKYYLQYPLIKP